VIQGDDLYLAHIGDSRGYLFRGRDLSRITEDHSVVEEEVRRGLLTAEQARVDPRRNLITAAIGLDLDPTVDTKSVELLSGDRIMFCTDGLNSMITDQEIGTILDRNDPQASCQGLIDAANDAGGEDNITIIVVDVIR
jgi:protein phosphatase